MKRLFHGLVPVCRKEFLHIMRDPGTLFFALLIPMLQLFLFGFAVDTNVRQIATVVLDESHTQESRRLLERFAGSDVFDLKSYAGSPEEMYEAIRSGKARVGIRIPYDYARRLQDGTTATVLVLVDGSDSTVAGQAVSTATGRGAEGVAGARAADGHDADRGAAVGAVQPGDAVGEFLCAGADCDPAADHDHSADCAEPGARARARHAGAVDDDAGGAARADAGQDDSLRGAGVRRIVRNSDRDGHRVPGADPRQLRSCCWCSRCRFC